jgi:hypothetical protein
VVPVAIVKNGKTTPFDAKMSEPAPAAAPGAPSPTAAPAKDDANKGEAKPAANKQ